MGMIRSDLEPRRAVTADGRIEMNVCAIFTNWKIRPISFRSCPVHHHHRHNLRIQCMGELQSSEEVISAILIMLSYVFLTLSSLTLCRDRIRSCSTKQGCAAHRRPYCSCSLRQPLVLTWILPANGMLHLCFVSQRLASTYLSEHWRKYVSLVDIVSLAFPLVTAAVGIRDHVIRFDGLCAHCAYIHIHT